MKYDIDSRLTHGKSLLYNLVPRWTFALNHTHTLKIQTHTHTHQPTSPQKSGLFVFARFSNFYSICFLIGLQVTETRTGPLGCSSYDNLDSVSSVLLQSPESKLHLQGKHRQTINIFHTPPCGVWHTRPTGSNTVLDTEIPWGQIEIQPVSPQKWNVIFFILIAIETWMDLFFFFFKALRELWFDSVRLLMLAHVSVWLCSGVSVESLIKDHHRRQRELIEQMSPLI